MEPARHDVGRVRGNRGREMPLSIPHAGLINRTAPLGGIQVRVRGREPAIPVRHWRAWIRQRDHLPQKADVNNYGHIVTASVRSTWDGSAEYLNAFIIAVTPSGN